MKFGITILNQNINKMQNNVLRVQIALSLKAH